MLSQRIPQVLQNGPEAIAHFDAAVARFISHKPLVCEALQLALDRDPDFVKAHSLGGFLQVLLARRETLAVARKHYANAQSALSRGRPSPLDFALTGALHLAIEGRLRKAAARLELHLENDPYDILCIKLAHALRFMAGDEAGMLAMTSRVLPHWRGSSPAHGYLLGCHSFALGEAGHLGASERAGREALEYANDDSWALHAVSHVYETRGDARAGIAWLQANRNVWSRCNNFSGHMAWHLALCHLSRGALESVLRIYDEEIRPAPSEDFRDVANAASLLWRVRQAGGNVGGRFEELHAIASRRSADATLIFASLHNLLSCVAQRDHFNAAAIAASIKKSARTRRDDQGRAARIVGVRMAKILMDFANGAPSHFNLPEMSLRLRALGGSHTQRDVFVRTLAQISAGERCARRDFMVA